MRIWALVFLTRGPSLGFYGWMKLSISVCVLLVCCICSKGYGRRNLHLGWEWRRVPSRFAILIVLLALKETEIK